MEDILPLLFADDGATQAVVPLLVKATILCLLGVAIGSEFSSLPAVARHRIALGTTLCLAALPFMAMMLSTWELPILPRAAEPASIEPSLAVNLLMSMYLVITGFLLLRLGVDLLRISLLSGRARATTTADELLTNLDHPRGNTPVKYSDEVSSPLTWGWLRPQILVPQVALAWKTEELSMVLQHELAHVQRRDWAVHLLTRVVHVLYWPIPGIRILMRQLSLSMEQACDDRVLATGVAPSQYAAMLLRHAQGNRIPASVSLGHSTELGTRIRNLVAEIVDHSTFATGSVATFLSCVLLTLPIATVQLGQRPEVPVVDWGSGAPKELPQASTYPKHTLQVDDAVLAALESGPDRPQPPPAPEKPPKINTLEKPTVPPPTSAPQ